jgi:hypothetical protein
MPFHARHSAIIIFPCSANTTAIIQASLGEIDNSDQVDANAARINCQVINPLHVRIRSTKYSLNSKPWWVVVQYHIRRRPIPSSHESPP